MTQSKWLNCRIPAVAIGVAAVYWLITSAVTAHHLEIGFLRSVAGDIPWPDLLHRITVLLLFMAFGLLGGVLAQARWDALNKAHEAAAQQLAVEQELVRVEDSRREWIHAFDAVRDLIFVHDAQGRILRANRAYAQYAGLSFRQLLGKPYWECFPRVSGPLPGCCPESGDRDSSPQVVTLEDGRIFNLRTYPVQGHMHRGRCWTAVLEDVTDQHRTHEALREREARITAIYEASRDISFIVTDLAGHDARVLEFSPGAERTFGYSRAEMVGQPVGHLHRPEDVKRFPHVLAAMAEQRAGFSGEATLVRRSGEQFPALFTSYPMFDERGEMIAALGVAVDISAQKQTEETLRRTLDELEAVFGSIQVMMVVMDAQFDYLRVNAAFAAAFDKRPEELVGQNHFNLFPNDAGLPYFQRAVETGLPQSTSAKPFSHPERGTTYWDCTVVALKGTHDSKEGFVLTAVDVTGREEAVRALRASEERFALAMQGANDGLWDWNVEADALYCSPRWAAMFGYEGEACFPSIDDWFPLIHPRDRARVFRRHAEILASDICHFERTYRMRHRNGHYLWILDRGTVVRDSQGKPVRVVGTHMDITARKQAEQEVETLTRLYTVLSEANKAIVRIGERDRLLAAICRILVDHGGFPMAWIGVSDATRRRVVPLASAGDDQRYLDAIGISFDKSAHKKGPAVQALKTGSFVIVNDIRRDPAMQAWAEPALARGYKAVSVFPIREHGEVFGFLAAYAAERNYFGQQRITLLAGLADDISFALDNIAREEARMAAESALQRAHEELESRVLERTAELREMNRQLEAFSYSVSHDLRGPLRAINGFASVLMDDYGPRLAGEAKDHLTRVKEASLRMDRLIDGLLKLTQIARAELHPQAVDLVEVAQQSLAELRRSAPAREVTFTCPKQLVAHADPYLIRVLLDNLLGNAWKFTGRQPDARIELGREHGEDGTRFFVRDNGAGFDMAYATQLFGAFQRLHAPDEFPGTGIGLATVARIVSAHRGQVWAEGEEGGGATFYWTLGTGTGQGAGATDRQLVTADFES